MDVTIGYHASHEQFAPADLLRYARAAEEAGFDAAMCSDHFHPWTTERDGTGNSGYTWSWLGAALEATRLSFGTVNAPGYRYHPAVIAQAAATLAQMYPGRFWLAVGSGEALNEHITGEAWPVKEERNARLLECVEIMRALWAGETVTHRGRVTVEEATLYTVPGHPPPLYGAALTRETARWAGGWADGLITVAGPLDELREMVAAFRERGGDKPMFLQAALSLAASEQEALRVARERWPVALLGPTLLAELHLPEQFDAAVRSAEPADMAGNVLAFSEAERCVETLGRYAELGFERIYLHHVGPDQERFIEVFGAKVLPALRGSGRG